MKSVIRSKFTYLRRFSAGGDWRRDLISAEVRFPAVYSYPVVSILHAQREVAKILPMRVQTEAQLCKRRLHKDNIEQLIYGGDIDAPTPATSPSRSCYLATHGR